MYVERLLRLAKSKSRQELRRQLYSDLYNRFAIVPRRKDKEKRERRRERDEAQEVSSSLLLPLRALLHRLPHSSPKPPNLHSTKPPCLVRVRDREWIRRAHDEWVKVTGGPHRAIN